MAGGSWDTVSFTSSRPSQNLFNHLFMFGPFREYSPQICFKHWKFSGPFLLSFARKLKLMRCSSERARCRRQVKRSSLQEAAAHSYLNAKTSYWIWTLTALDTAAVPPGGDSTANGKLFPFPEFLAYILSSITKNKFTTQTSLSYHPFINKIIIFVSVFADSLSIESSLKETRYYP